MGTEQTTNVKFVQEIEKHPCLYNFRLPDYTRKNVTDRVWGEIGAKFGLSVKQSKEKWKNLRGVFVRTIRAQKSDSHRKQYYLADFLQFTIPFIKIGKTKKKRPQARQRVSFDNVDSSSLLCERPQPLPTQFVIQTLPPTTSQPIIKHEMEISLSPATSPPIIKEETYISSTSPQSISQEPPSPSSATESHSRQTIRKRRRTLQGKKKLTKMMRNCGGDQGNSNKMFLLSLLSDMNKMNDMQRRFFKRKVLDLVDEVMDENNKSDSSDGAPDQ